MPKHFLSFAKLKEKIIKHKPFLLELLKCKALQRFALIKAASAGDIHIVASLIHSYFKKHIPIPKRHLKRITTNPGFKFLKKVFSSKIFDFKKCRTALIKNQSILSCFIRNILDSSKQTTRKPKKPKDHTSPSDSKIDENDEHES